MIGCADGDLAPAGAIVKSPGAFVFYKDPCDRHYRGEGNADFDSSTGAAHGAVPDQRASGGIGDRRDAGAAWERQGPADAAFDQTFKCDEQATGQDHSRGEVNAERAGVEGGFEDRMTVGRRVLKKVGFGLAGVGGEALPAECHLRVVALDRGALCGAFGVREVQAHLGARRFGRRMDEVVEERGAVGERREGELQLHGERIVIGMYVVQRGRRDNRREKGRELPRQGGDGLLVGAEQCAGRALIGPAEKTHVAFRHAEDLQGSQRFRPPPRAPALAFPRPDPPAALEETLRPRVIVAVTDEDDPHLRLDPHRALNQPGAGQGFIVRVRRDDEQSVARGEIERRRQIEEIGERWTVAPIQGVRPAK